jgi:hypothetical protein
MWRYVDPLTPQSGRIIQADVIVGAQRVANAVNFQLPAAVVARDHEAELTLSIVDERSNL